jgi:hypothetical protein
MLHRLDGYVSAGTIPWKVLRSDTAIRDGKIVPQHVQFMPTNKCDRNCTWCSCSLVDRSKEMPCEEMLELLSYFVRLGMRAITITGGGEPSLYPFFVQMLHSCLFHGVEIGLVTNGFALSNNDEALSILDAGATWTRISIPETTHGCDLTPAVSIIERLTSVDIGISFTVDHNTSTSAAMCVCDLAHEHNNVTHVRFVHNILDPDENAMNRVEESCRSLTNKAIFQRRNLYQRGSDRCLISLLKPVIDATGHVYPCCGVQYATEDTRRLPEAFKMCHWTEFHKTDPFDGSICQKCYYGDYNKFLAGLTDPLEHEVFV